MFWVSHHGVEILINGAGINSPTPFLEITNEEYEQILNINLKPVFFSLPSLRQGTWLERGCEEALSMSVR